LRRWPKKPGVSITLTGKERDLTKRTAKLTDPDFTEFPFTFDIADETFYKGAKVIIKDGTFEGGHPGAYQITYLAKTSDGKTRLIRQQELSKARKR